MKKNYHTHCRRCLHATGTVRDYVQVAVEAGYDELGMSDHCPYPGDVFRTEWGPMKWTELPEYYQEIETARVEFPGIKIWRSLECEFQPEHAAMYEKFVRENDYLILGQHFFAINGRTVEMEELAHEPKLLLKYVDHLEQGLKTGWFKYLAHPDFFGWFLDDWDELCTDVTHRIFTAVKESGVVAEVNLKGMRSTPATMQKDRYYYPWHPAWEIVRKYYPETPVIIGVDAHHPAELADEETWEKALALVQEWGLNLIDKFEVEK